VYLILMEEEEEDYGQEEFAYEISSTKSKNM
jgi:hypothetical protein